MALPPPPPTPIFPSPPTPPPPPPPVPALVVLSDTVLIDPVDLNAGIGLTISGLGPIASIEEDEVGIEFLLSPGGFPLILYRKKKTIISYNDNSTYI